MRTSIQTKVPTLKVLPIPPPCTNPPLLLPVADLLAAPLASQISSLALSLYKTAHAHALSHGLILADTKFEFGLDPSTNPPSIVLVDEVLTPDSSRYWPADKY